MTRSILFFYITKVLLGKVSGNQDINMVYIISQNLRLWALICIVSLLFHASPSTQNRQLLPSFNSQHKLVEGSFIKSLEPDAAATVFSVDSHGAKGDGTSDDTQAFSAAWNAACTSSSSSVFLVPQGKKYLVKPINLKGPCKGSDMIAQISGIIVAPDDPASWNSQDSSVWLQFSNLQGARIQGGGTIYGSGQKWWENSCKRDKRKSCRQAPSAMTIDSSTHVIISNLKFQNSQQMHLVISGSTNVQVQNLQIFAPEDSPNTDGIHISTSQHVVVQNCKIGTGDDCVSIVSQSSDVKISKLVCGPGHGISIGSLGKDNAKGTVSDVVVDGAYLTGTENGVRIKTWQGGSGYAKGIIFKNVIMNRVSNPIIIDQYYCDSQSPCQNQSSGVQVSDVTYTDISGTSATKEAIRVACSKSVPCRNIVMENINLIHMDNGDPAIAFCENVHVLSRGRVDPPPLQR